MIRLILLALLTSCGGGSDVEVYRLAKDDQSKSTESKLPIQWDTPMTWKELPASGMRQGSFRAQNTDISIIFLEGDAGGHLANVNRWRGQIGLSPWSEKEAQSASQSIPTPLGPAKVVDFETDTEKTVGAILPYGNGTWFFKMVGHPREVSRETQTFLTFLQKVRPS